MFSYNNLLNISRDDKTELCNIMTRNLSDKGNGWHNYTKLYDRLFKNRRNDKLNILEIGIGSVNPNIPSNMTGGELGKYYRPGASVRGWHEYFHNTQIYCCDIDTAILHFEEERIQGFYMNQADESCLRYLVTDGMLKDVEFDIIIDDGLHHFPTNLKVMDYLLPKVKKGGYYIIEDIVHSEYIHTTVDISKLNGRNYQYVRLPNEQNNVDNNLFIVDC